MPDEETTQTKNLDFVAAGVEFPEFPTTFTESDQARLEDVEKQKEEITDIYGKKFAPEAWKDTNILEKGFRQVASRVPMAGTILSWLPDEAGFEYGIIPSQVEGKMESLEQEYLELVRKKRVSETLPSIRTTINYLALIGKAIQSEEEFDALFKLDALGYNDKEKEMVLQYAQAVSGMTPEEIMAGKGAEFSAEDVKRWMTENMPELAPSYIMSSVAFSTDLNKIGEALQAAYPAETFMSDAEIKAKLLAQTVENLKGLFKYLGLEEIEGEKPEDTATRILDAMAQQGKNMLLYSDDVGEYFVARQDADGFVWVYNQDTDTEELIGMWDEEQGGIIPVDPNSLEPLTNDEAKEWWLKDIWDMVASSAILSGQMSVEGLLTQMGTVTQKNIETMSSISGGTPVDKNWKDFIVGGYESLMYVNEKGNPYPDNLQKALARQAEDNKNWFLKAHDVVEEWNQQFWRDHPEMAKRPGYEGAIWDNWSNLYDPWYWGYTITDMAPLITTYSVATAVTGNPISGAVVGSIVLMPMFTEQMYDECIQHGATPSEAGEIATIVGIGEGVLFMVPSMITMKAILPSAVKSIEAVFNNTSRSVLRSALQSSIASFGKIEATGVALMTINKVMHNAALEVVDPEVGLFDDLTETAVQSAISFLPLAVLGAGTNFFAMKKKLSVKRQAELDAERVKYQDLPIPEDVKDAMAFNDFMELSDEIRVEVEMAKEAVKAEIPETKVGIDRAVGERANELATIRRDIKEHTTRRDSIQKQLDEVEGRTKEASPAIRGKIESLKKRLSKEQEVLSELDTQRRTTINNMKKLRDAKKYAPTVFSESFKQTVKENDLYTFAKKAYLEHMRESLSPEGWELFKSQLEGKFNDYLTWKHEKAQKYGELEYLDKGDWKSAFIDVEDIIHEILLEEIPSMATLEKLNNTFVNQLEAQRRIEAMEARGVRFRITKGFEWSEFDVLKEVKVGDTIGEAQLREIIGIEDKIFVGDFSMQSFLMHEIGSPKRTEILRARAEYNAFRESIGMERITDWNVKPKETIRNLSKYLSEEVYKAEQQPLEIWEMTLDEFSSSLRNERVANMQAVRQVRERLQELNQMEIDIGRLHKEAKALKIPAEVEAHAKRLEEIRQESYELLGEQFRLEEALMKKESIEDHRIAVEEAIKRGEQVPEEAVVNYPELQALVKRTRPREIWQMNKDEIKSLLNEHRSGKRADYNIEMLEQLDFELGKVHTTSVRALTMSLKFAVRRLTGQVDPAKMKEGELSAYLMLKYAYKEAKSNNFSLADIETRLKKYMEKPELLDKIMPQLKGREITKGIRGDIRKVKEVEPEKILLERKVLEESAGVYEVGDVIYDNYGRVFVITEVSDPVNLKVISPFEAGERSIPRENVGGIKRKASTKIPEPEQPLYEEITSEELAKRLPSKEQIQKDALEYFGTAGEGEAVGGIMPDGTQLKSARKQGAFAHGEWGEGMKQEGRFPKADIVRIINEKDGTTNVDVTEVMTEKQIESLDAYLKTREGDVAINYIDAKNDKYVYFKGNYRRFRNQILHFIRNRVGREAFLREEFAPFVYEEGGVPNAIKSLKTPEESIQATAEAEYRTQGISQDFLPFRHDPYIDIQLKDTVAKLNPKILEKISGSKRDQIHALGQKTLEDLKTAVDAYTKAATEYVKRGEKVPDFLKERNKEIKKQYRQIREKSGIAAKYLRSKEWNTFTAREQDRISIACVEDATFSLFRGKFMSRWWYADSRHVMRALEAVTGLPFGKINEHLVRMRQQVEFFRQQYGKRLQNMPDSHRVIGNDEATARVCDIINSQRKGSKQKAPDYAKLEIEEAQVTAEQAFAKEISNMYKEWEPVVRFLRFIEGYEDALTSEGVNMAEFRQFFHKEDVIQNILEEGVKVYEEKGEFGLWQYLFNKEGGVIDTGYDMLAITQPQLFSEAKKLSVRGRGRLLKRQTEEALRHEEKTQLLTRLDTYTLSIGCRFLMRNDIKLLSELHNASFSKWVDPSYADNFLTRYIEQVQGFREEGNTIAHGMNKLYSAAAPVIFWRPYLSFRNLFQPLWAYPERTKLMKSFLTYKRDVPDDVKSVVNTYFITNVDQSKAGFRDILNMSGVGLMNPKLWKGNPLTLSARLATKLAHFPKTDYVSRIVSFQAAFEQAWKAGQEYAKTGDVNKWIKNSGVEHLSADCKKDILHYLDLESYDMQIPGLRKVSGIEASSLLVAENIVADYLYLYSRFSRSYSEWGEFGRPMGSLMVFPRSTVQMVGREISKLWNPEVSVADKARATRNVFTMMVAGYFLNASLQAFSGSKRDEYGFTSILDWKVGGLQLSLINDSLEAVYSILHVAFAGDNEEKDDWINRTFDVLPALGDDFVFLYNQGVSIYEAMAGEKSGVDKRFLRNIRHAIDENYTPKQQEEIERTWFEAFQHVLTGTSDPEMSDYEIARRDLIDAESELGSLTMDGGFYTVKDLGSVIQGVMNKLPDDILTEHYGFSPLVSFYVESAKMWEAFEQQPTIGRDEWRRANLVAEARMLFWGKHDQPVSGLSYSERMQLERMLSHWFEVYEINKYEHPHFASWGVQEEEGEFNY